MIKSFWEGLGARFGDRGRLGLSLGTVFIVVLLVAGSYWILRPEYQVLFGDLSPQDAAAMTAELERQKMPYTLSDQGGGRTSILMEKAEVYKTRIKLMGKEIPLHGAVGFELFNNSDFGMTEFAQKINYQRALQGELTRTILSLSEIRDARVLLALPEQGLFKQASSKPKASVTLTLKDGMHLRGEQVGGIQRLVAAAVPGIQAQDVTLVDQNGVALTRVSDSESEAGWAGGTRLDLKKETENYLSRKAGVVLERALGPGQALASVDVSLDMDRVQTSTEEIIGAPSRTGEVPSGIVVRERETNREGEVPLRPGGGNEGKSPLLGGSRQSETEYAVGKRVEQVVTQPGAVRRIQVAVVVHRALSAEQQDRLRAMVLASVGGSSDRGDEVVLQTLDGLGGAAESQRPVPGIVQVPEGKAESAGFPVPQTDRSPKGWMLLAAGAALAVLAALGWAMRPGKAPLPDTLSDAQREAALAQIKAWMGGSGFEGGNS
ncbi:flagellar basal-body MS-ring/collar protein FliF [Holophaga foetida]|uniref:flagellar basal-body MS-ring/collar protein FliF n=1 Tax=Holophaga foetida TaxID=35839 RepID=UPI000247464D|nr:flagellar basal-body MS-ring/collar protein FliF [Holophaga foetida]